MRPRLLWIDFLRGLAVLGMIEAHSVNSFLNPAFRSGSWFTLLSYINGWVAPTFLFIAGFLQGSWVRENWDAPKPIAPKLRSLGVILLIGYALQFPWDSVTNWEKVSLCLGKIDVLHCIAVSLAVLLLLSRCCKKLTTYSAFIFLTILAVVVSAPFVWQSLAVLQWTNPLVGYLSPHRGALFPLLPWSGFLLAGTLASCLPELGGEKRVIPKKFAILFLLTTAAGWLLRALLGDWFQTQTYATRYDFFFFRLALVLLSCTLCIRFLTNENPGYFVRSINWCGSHSLSLYVWHLVLLHSGLGIIDPLRSLFPKTQTPLNTFLLYLLVLIGTLALSWLWKRFFSQARQTIRGST